MKKLMLLMAVAVASLMLAGCSKADENKTPEQIKQEVAKMDAKDIQAVIDDYQKAIAAKKADLEKEAAKLKELKLEELTGDKAKSIKDNMANLTKSIDKLSANMAAYADGLKK